MADPRASATGADAAYVRAVAGIVDALVDAYEQQEPVNMTRLKNDVAKRYRLPSMPKVPPHFHYSTILITLLAHSPSLWHQRHSSWTLSRPCRTTTATSCSPSCAPSPCAPPRASPSWYADAACWTAQR